MSRQIHFFATRGDLLPILECVEGEVPLRYAQFGHSDSDEPKIFDAALALPSLGIANNESAHACARYLVVPKTVQIRARPIAATNKYAFDQLWNQQTVTFLSGGFWGVNVLLSGNIGAAHKTPESDMLIKRFQAAFRKRASKVKSYYLGSEAHAFWEKGGRLTFAVQSPPEYDLRK
jgi:hypothetical protein